MDILPPLIAPHQAPKTVQPRQSALHHPPVPTQPFARLDPAPPGYAGGYAPLPEGPCAPGEVVALIRVQLLRALARGRPRGLRIGQTASTASSNALESWTLAAVWTTAR